MMLLNILIIGFSCSSMASEVVENFKAESVVPDVVDVAPKAKISLIYPGNKEVNFNELTPTVVRPQQPEVKWETDPNKFYTLSNVDPDAPSRATPTFREINHWLVVNINGNDLSTGQTLVSYRGSGAPRGTGLHRYIFLVFEQQGEINVTEIQNLANDVTKFSIRKFAQKYNLGNPVAGNFYLAQWDSSVPERKQ
ncbi:unnamed protein product [Ceutorhynchus assimilis]|uniref:Uncharacterized protein n=1 Tax=Ceutorhynchus assimilis TaxID=467358 RepID=A0A9N9MS24_9CUCU|nr:unnamed protein product [Ceutorhynchus assimilis]